MAKLSSEKKTAIQSALLLIAGAFAGEYIEPVKFVIALVFGWF